jgi:glycosyltransferase involved in cell wall biosynthesis
MTLDFIPALREVGRGRAWLAGRLDESITLDVPPMTLDGQAALAPTLDGPSPPGCLDRSLRSTKPTVTVVIPTLNESRNIPYAMWRLPECVTEVIVVDGRSSDDTALTAALMRRDVRVVLEPTKGKGAALKRGFSEATGDIIVMLDADGSADGGEIQRFVDVLLAGADFAKGSRFLPGGGSADLTRIRSLGNRTLTGIVNLICQTRFSDLCYGYNAFWSDCLDFIEVDVSGFEVETRLMMTVATTGLAMVEVPSWEYNRVHGVSNLNAVRDGLRVLRSIANTTMEIRRGRASVRCRPLEVDNTDY